MFFLVVALAFMIGSQAVEFKIKNNQNGPIWIGILGNNGKPALNNGGFKLNPGQEKSAFSDNNWAGRFWARTWCNDGSNHCKTGDCGNKVECGGAGGVPPATLVEITLRGDGGKDFYDVSLVDGFNSQATIQPVGGTGDCKTIGCNADVNKDCPNELKVIGSSSNGQTIACKSSCLKYNTDQYCCRNNYGNPNTCKTNDWPVNSAKYFKSKCPNAYSYAYDDGSSTFTCISSVYKISFN